jgi:hypothetical protein
MQKKKKKKSYYLIYLWKNRLYALNVKKNFFFKF